MRSRRGDSPPLRFRLEWTRSVRIVSQVFRVGGEHARDRIGFEEGPDRGFILIGKCGEVAAFDAFAIIRELAGAASDVGNIEYRVPLDPLVDRKVLGEGEWLAVIAGIEARLTSAHALSRSQSRRLAR